MEVSEQPQKMESDGVKKRAKCAGIRVIGGRIYDSQNGVCCHQCRQKTRDFAASCKNMKGHKPCPIKFCHKCLLNRYGEKAQEVDVLNDWKCPKCRGICNCSLCMKRRGQTPTGPLAYTAKASGFSSVSEMLEVKVPNATGSDNFKNFAVSPRKAATSKRDQMIDVDSISDNVAGTGTVSNKMPVAIDKELVVALSGNQGKENSLDGNSGLSLDCRKAKEKPKKKKREGLKEICNGSRVDEETKQNASDDIDQVQKKVFRTRALKDLFLNSDKKDVKEEKNEQNCKGTVNNEINNVIPLPPASILKDIQDIEFPPEDVGHALQFLEFCTAFKKVLDMKEGEAEAILEELICKQNSRRAQKTLVVQFYIRLLTLILSESGNESPSLKSTSGKNSWLRALRDLILGSDIAPKELQLDCLDESIDGYYNLDLSKKLRLLNFLCDESLGTESIRSYIDEQNSKFAKKAKDAKIKVAAAKEKEKSLKQKLKDDLAKAIISKNGAPLSISEHENLISKIKSEAARAHVAMLEAKGMVPKRKQGSDAMRTEPVFIDGSGQAFWKLRCYAAEYAVLLQDIKIQDAAATEEKWFIYGAEQKNEIEMYISSRAKRPRICDVSCTFPNEISKANM